jgi:hypothetical protein
MPVYQAGRDFAATGLPPPFVLLAFASLPRSESADTLRLSTSVRAASAALLTEPGFCTRFTERVYITVAVRALVPINASRRVKRRFPRLKGILQVLRFFRYGPGPDGFLQSGVKNNAQKGRPA